MNLRPNENTIRQRVWALVEPVCVDAGYEVVDVRFVTEQSGWVLRVFIDAAPAEPEASADGAAGDAPAASDEPVDGPIDLSDCERISREISAVLDVDDTIAAAYSLEVSSPGIDRPLVTVAHFRRYIGAELKVTLHQGVPTPSIAGAQSSDRKNFRGHLIAVHDDGAAALAEVLVDGQPWRLPIADVDQARIVPDWDAVMKGGRGQLRPLPGAEPPTPAKKGPRGPHAHTSKPAAKPGHPPRAR